MLFTWIANLRERRQAKRRARKVVSLYGVRLISLGHQIDRWNESEYRNPRRPFQTGYADATEAARDFNDLVERLPDKGGSMDEDEYATLVQDIESLEGFVVANRR